MLVLGKSTAFIVSFDLFNIYFTKPNNTTANSLFKHLHL